MNTLSGELRSKSIFGCWWLPVMCEQDCDSTLCLNMPSCMVAKPSRTSPHRADEIGGEGVARQGLRNVDCVELTRWARRGV